MITNSNSMLALWVAEAHERDMIRQAAALRRSRGADMAGARAKRRRWLAPRLRLRLA